MLVYGAIAASTMEAVGPRFDAKHESAVADGGDARICSTARRLPARTQCAPPNRFNSGGGSTPELHEQGALLEGTSSGRDVAALWLGVVAADVARASAGQGGYTKGTVRHGSLELSCLVLVICPVFLVRGAALQGAAVGYRPSRRAMPRRLTRLLTTAANAALARSCS
jgi:hypothetical protein